MGIPNQTSHPGASLKHKYVESLSNSVVEITSKRANLFGFAIENNSSSPIYLQIFDKPASQVTLGTTVPIDTWLVSGPAAGRDPQPHALYHLPEGFSVAVTASRGSSSAPASDAPAAPASLRVWYWDV